jgi:acetyl-CoA carboxylase carboxyl transferase subunit alpha
MSDFVELHGDRRYADDPAIITGFAHYRGQPVAVVGHQKGRDTKQKLYRNFGMPKPEGYRKALRVMRLAEKFGRPIVCFIDTPGADPGIGAEERGQAQAIAENLRVMAELEVPIVVTVTGEGGSGGALAIGVGDVVNMLEFATYSVITPEACSAILWRNQDKKVEAAENLRLSAPDLANLGIIDTIVPEPLGGAHADPARAAELVDEVLHEALGRVSKWSVQERIEHRYKKFRSMGVYAEQPPPETTSPSDQTAQ